MLFNSINFVALFLPITLGVYYCAQYSRTARLSQIALLLASLVFYAAWSEKYLVLLLGSVIMNHQLGGWIIRSRRFRKLLFCFAIFGNLAVLGYYKYSAFLIRTLNEVFHCHYDVPLITLPLAISFFTFTQIVYLVDCHRKLTKNYGVFEYALFVCTFQHLIAGPIVHHYQLIPQLTQPENARFNVRNFTTGLTAFILGLAKKVLIADQLAAFVDPIFQAHQKGLNVSAFESWMAALFYTYQIYFDFSGYSEMALGLGLLFNLSLPINFFSPYVADSFSDFWRRWHISLSLFFRDYVYIPLGGNRGSVLHVAMVLLGTMFLSGLWHGAGWTFIFWGLLHGFYLLVQLWIPIKNRWLTFLGVVVAWVFFRASTVPAAIHQISSMFGFANGTSDAQISVPLNRMGIVILLSALSVIVFLCPNVIQLLRLDPRRHFLKDYGPVQVDPPFRWGWAICTSFLLLICLILMSSGSSEFIYYQF